MTDHTHVVVGKAHIRSGNHPTEDTSQPKVVYEAGDEITPTERELESFPYRFAAIADDDPDEEPDADEELREEPPLDDLEYADLQALAADYDDIKGNWSEDRLRAELDAVINE